MSMVELMISLSILLVVLISSAAAFTNSIATGARAERLTEGALFLESVVEDTAAVEFDDLLALNGDRVFDDEEPDSADFAVDLDVFAAGVELLQLRFRLIDLRTDDELGRASTLRASW